MVSRVEVRDYRDEDRAPTRQVFERAVRVTAFGDYSREQVEAWAPVDIDEAAMEAWGAARASAQTVVAVEGGEVLGFSDLVGGAVLDMLYVDPRAGRRGVATALLDRVLALAREAGAETIETDASITARPFFEHHGFVTLAEQSPVVDGIAMTNFKMRRSLA
jgi:putative acetyltransferase